MSAVVGALRAGAIALRLRSSFHSCLLQQLINNKSPGIKYQCRYISNNMDSLELVPDVVDKLSTEIVEVQY